MELGIKQLLMKQKFNKAVIAGIVTLNKSQVWNQSKE